MVSILVLSSLFSTSRLRAFLSSFPLEPDEPVDQFPDFAATACPYFPNSSAKMYDNIPCNAHSTPNRFCTSTPFQPSIVIASARTLSALAWPDTHDLFFLCLNAITSHDQPEHLSINQCVAGIETPHNTKAWTTNPTSPTVNKSQMRCRAECHLGIRQCLSILWFQLRVQDDRDPSQ